MRHFHGFRSQHRYAQWSLYECRCGKRKTVLLGMGFGYSPLMPGWPRPTGGKRVAVSTRP